MVDSALSIGYYLWTYGANFGGTVYIFHEPASFETYMHSSQKEKKETIYTCTTNFQREFYQTDTSSKI